MNKEELKKDQPIVYRILSNALKRNQLAHAYLFSGQKGTPKLEAALLLAQSILCPNPDEDGFCCEQCDQCKRVAKEESLDFFWKHHVGYIKKVDSTFSSKKKKEEKEERIKKQDILALQRFFESTSMEDANKRVYILEDYDQATVEASNSLLKFLEEPQPGIYGILIADDKNRILPTIQSRCQSIHFSQMNKSRQIQRFESFTEEDNAKMLVESGYDFDQAKSLVEKESFPIIKQAAFDYIKNWDSYDEIYRLQTKVFIPKGPLMDKEWIRLWLEWLNYMVKNHKSALSFEKEVDLQFVIVEAFDKLRAPLDLALFLDQLYTQIRKVVVK